MCGQITSYSTCAKQEIQRPHWLIFLKYSWVRHYLIGTLNSPCTSSSLWLALMLLLRMTHWPRSLRACSTKPVSGEDGAPGGDHWRRTPRSVWLADRSIGGSRIGRVVTAVGDSVGTADRRPNIRSNWYILTAKHHERVRETPNRTCSLAQTFSPHRNNCTERSRAEFILR